MLDLLLSGGFVLDFEKDKLLPINLGIKEGRIAYLGEEFVPAKELLRLKGEVISPGFIDIHMHEEQLSLTKGKYDIALAMLSMGVTTAVGGNCGNNRQSLEEFIAHIDRFGSPIHYMSYIGHSSLREQVGNLDTKAVSTKKQIREMKFLIEKAIDLGAVGLSFGLEYASGASFEELLDVSEPLFGRKDLLLSAHYRKDAKGALDAIEEMAQLGKKTRTPFQISHLSSCSAFGMMEEALKLIRKHQEEGVDLGVDLSVDAYPYAAFSTLIGSDVFEEGCFERWGVGYDAIELTEAPYENLRCTKEIFFDARKNHPEMIAIAHVMKEEEVELALADPMVMIASDGVYRNSKGHPRGAGTFPRFIGKYLRDEKLMDFVQGMKKITLLPAERLGLKKKGRIELGADADLTIFDRERIIDRAVFGDGQRPPVGISYVFLGGEKALDHGQILREDLGVFLRKNQV